MRIKKEFVAAVVALTLGVGMTGVVQANDKMTPAEREKKLDKMASELKLTQDQKNKIREIKDEKYREIEEAKKEAHDKIRGVLTPDQQGKFDKMLQDKD